MKKCIRCIMLIVFVITLLLTGCATSIDPLPQTPADPAPLQVVATPSEYPTYRIFTIDPNAVDETTVTEIPEEPVPLASVPLDISPEDPLTKRDAETIAIQYAGLTHNDVSFLFTKEESDNGILLYEVNFRSGHYEYEIEVHAETGEIYTYEKEDIRSD